MVFARAVASTLLACRLVLSAAPSPQLYVCQSGQCVINSRGLPLSECEAACLPPPNANYTCQGSQCVVSARGLPKAECTQVCGGPAPPAPPAPPRGKTIVDLAVATPDLSTLVTALKAGSLVATLSGPGPFTVFAPTNEAFAALPAGEVASLLKPDNKAKLDDILTYHVVSGAVRASELKDGERLKTVEGKYLTVRVDGSTVLINSAKVTIGDVTASNGVVHIIDGVLMASPPPPPLWFRGWTGGTLGRYLCGEVDAGPRMPAAIFDPSNAASLEAYVNITIALYGLDRLHHSNDVILELGRCSTNNYTRAAGEKTVDWTGWTIDGPIDGPHKPLMDGICREKCHCEFADTSGFSKTFPLRLPTCIDEPDDPTAEKWCSLCGPKFNSPININIFRCTKPGVVKEVCPGPKPPRSRTRLWGQVLADLLGNL